MRYLLLAAAMAGLTACAGGPKASYIGCESHILRWTFGPAADQPFLDMCYTRLDIGEAEKYYTFVPMPGQNPDTRQVIDANRDGISDGIRRNARKQGNKIYWGAICQQSALRVKQQGCRDAGDSERTSGCDWIAIQIKAKPGVKDKQIALTPVWHVRLPDGSEQSIQAKTLVTGFEQCN